MCKECEVIPGESFRFLCLFFRFVEDLLKLRNHGVLPLARHKQTLLKSFGLGLRLSLSVLIHTAVQMWKKLHPTKFVDWGGDSRLEVDLNHQNEDIWLNLGTSAMRLDSLEKRQLEDLVWPCP